MFWDRVAFVYDIFADVINAKTHRSLCRAVANEIEEDDDVLECACGTGMLTKAAAAGAGARESSDKRIAAGMCAGGAVCAAFAGLLLKGYKRTDAD